MAMISKLELGSILHMHVFDELSDNMIYQTAELEHVSMHIEHNSSTSHLITSMYRAEVLYGHMSW